MTTAYRFEIGSDDDELTNEFIQSLPLVNMPDDVVELTPDYINVEADGYDFYAGNRHKFKIYGDNDERIYFVPIAG